MVDREDEYDEEYEDWPYDDVADDELVRELMEEWADIDDVDDFKYVDEREDF